MQNNPVMMRVLILILSFNTTQSNPTPMIPPHAARVYEKRSAMQSNINRMVIKNLALKFSFVLRSTTNIAGMSNANAAPYDVWSRKNGCITRYDASCEKNEDEWFTSV